MALLVNRCLLLVGCAVLLSACEASLTRDARDAQVSPSTVDANTSSARDAQVQPRQDAQAPSGDGSSSLPPRYDVEPNASCQGLFGRPNASSGLMPGQCTPVCTCGDEEWSPPDYSAEFTDALKTWSLVEPFAPITSDPYASSSPTPEKASVVCGVLPEPGGSRRYRLIDYDSPELARQARAFITHTGACGVCSTLTDLSVYIENQDLTEPVRQCGLDHLAGTQDEHVGCLQKLGFTLPCAQVWYYNTLHTRGACTIPCFSQVNAPFHKPDGSLNECLQCDEDKSGPVFKAVAGRTRRNSGLANALCRPCSDVSRVEHRYE